MLFLVRFRFSLSRLDLAFLLGFSLVNFVDCFSTMLCYSTIAGADCSPLFAFAYRCFSSTWLFLVVTYLACMLIYLLYLLFLQLLERVCMSKLYLCAEYCNTIRVVFLILRTVPIIAKACACCLNFSLLGKA